VRFPVVERRMIAGQRGQPAVHEVPERLAVRWHDFAVPERSMHPLVSEKTLQLPRCRDTHGQKAIC